MPENIKALRNFLGLMNYFVRFIHDYSKLTHPLRNLLKKGNDFIWYRKCQKAFKSLKQSFCNETCINYFDKTKELIK